MQFNFPANARPSQRATFTDRTLQFSMRNEMTRGWFGAQSSFDFAGSTFQAEALRFGTLGNKAPQVRAPDSDRLPNCSIFIGGVLAHTQADPEKRRSGPCILGESEFGFRRFSEEFHKFLNTSPGHEGSLWSAE